MSIYALAAEYRVLPLIDYDTKRFEEDLQEEYITAAALLGYIAAAYTGIPTNGSTLRMTVSRTVPHHSNKTKEIRE